MAKKSAKESTRKTGRKEKIHSVRDDIVALIRSGVSHEDAAAMVGISEATLYRWKEKGRVGDAPVYITFYEDVRRAEVEAKIRKIRVVENGALEDPKLALELLARKYPGEWGRKDRHEITGEGGGPVPIQVVSSERLNL